MNLSLELQNHWLWQDKPFAKWQAWVDLNLLATNECILFRGKVYNLPPNKLITSESELRKRWGWSRTKVRSFLEQLNNELMITSEASHINTIITITENNKKHIPKQDKRQVEIPPKSPENKVEEEHPLQGKEQVESHPRNKQRNTRNKKTAPEMPKLCFQVAQNK